MTITEASRSDAAANQKTEVLHGKQNVVNTVLQFTFKAKNTIDACVDYTRPSLAIEIEELRKAFLDAKRRGVKLRYVTEITHDNLVYCKELLKMIDELRHINGIKGNFYISETEYIAPATFHEKGKPASRIIYSNVSDIVEYQRQFVFDSFWSRAIPAEQKIKEIEEGTIRYETKVLENKERIFDHMKSVIGTSSARSVVSSVGGMKLVYNNFFEEYKKIIDKQREDGSGTKGKGRGKGVRWITSIDSNSIELVKIFLNAGIQIRHLKDLTPMYFAVDDRYFYATIDKMQDGKLMQSLLTSNEPAYVEHYNSIFEELWNNAVDAAQRIEDIESGVHLADIEVIPSSAKTQQLYLDIVKSASEELLWIFPTANALIRQEKIGAIQLAREAVKERNVKVRILVPANSLIEQKIQQLKEHCCYSSSSSYNDIMIDARYIEQMSETKATILVIDRKTSLVMELKDDSKPTFIEAIGLSTYSNSKAGVSSYVAIFENLWRQAELYNQLKEAHEQLKKHDKMQEEFINIAAHELRTPIQPILGLTQVIRDNTKDPKQYELLDITIRNAKRLQQLTEDILNVTKIESQSLNLNKERFSLKNIISNAIDDIMTNMQSSSSTNNNDNNDNTIKLLYHQPQNVFIYADKGRISQVVSNLLDNAVKFTKDGGTISIRVEKKEKGEEQNNNQQQQIVVSIKDAGTGIDPQIFPRLFTKFATTSQTRGTGLGLFICKGIIEAHGGKIWAENNADSKGSTFSFSLPLVNNARLE